MVYLFEAMEASSHTQQDEDITFKLQLNCIARKSSKIQTLRLNPFSPSVQDIKKAIENEFSIPTCVQTLRYQSMTLPDEGSLLDACGYIRMGDVLTVDYTCEADVKRMNEVIEWIRRVNAALEKETDLPYTMEIETEAVIDEGSINDYDFLAIEIFEWMQPRGFVNKLHFQESGGLRDLVTLYERVITWEWGEMWQMYKYLEVFCSGALTNFGETLHFRRVLIQHGVMKMAMRSMLRVELEIKGNSVVEKMDPDQSDAYTLYAQKMVLENSLYTICKYVHSILYSHGLR